MAGTLALRGILATILSTLSDHWHPSADLLQNLARQVGVGATELAEVAVAEPLAFTLAAKGDMNLHASWLWLLLGDKDVADSEWARIKSYYRDSVALLDGIERHVGDVSHRRGTMIANDVGRLLKLVETVRSPSRDLCNRIARLVYASMGAIQDSGHTRLLASIRFTLEDIASAAHSNAELLHHVRGPIEAIARLGCVEMPSIALRQ